MSNVMSTFDRANVLDPVYNKHNRRFNLYGQYGKNFRSKDVSFLEMAEQYNKETENDANHEVQSFAKIEST